MATKMSEDPAAQVVVDADNPWPGLDFFAEKSRAFFHGRDAEADLLLTMVRHRLLTVLYGQSGLGKSSLLQAGLFPRLRADGWLPVYVRLSHTDADGLGGKGTSALIAQTRQFIREAIADAIEQGQLLSAKPGDPSPMPRDDESLWEYLHRKVSGLRSATRERVAPVLVFDQFEEIFTLGRSESRQAIRQAFLRDLADCVENRLPEHVLKEMNRKQPGDDRFTELDFQRQDYRVVLSLREDYLAELHDLSDLMPSIHENETRLVPLNGWQALDAVAIPGEKLVEPVIAREIVEIVAASRRGEPNETGGSEALSNGEHTDEAKLEIDPALLSMVCRGLNDERKRRKASRITQEITNELLKNSGQSILHRFYVDCFHSLPERASAPEVQKFVEDELLTPTGYRNMAELVRAQNRLSKAGVADPSRAIQRLIDQRLLRVSERRQDKTKWLELTHDVLCDVVKESRQTRELRETAEREEREQRERAARRLEEAERQRAEAEAQARQAREREEAALVRLKQMRRERRLGIAAALLTIGLVGALGLFAYQAYKNTENARQVQQRIRGMLERAKDRLAKTDDDRRNAMALRGLARAIRLDPNSTEAVKLTEQLLLGKNWSPPLSQALHHPQPLMCAAFTPDNRQIVAVAQDGNLVRWNAQDFTQLSNVALVPSKLRGERALSSAAFSNDGKRILVALNPSGKENARVWGWSEQDGEYRQGTMVSVEFKDAFRSIAWSGDGDSLFIFPARFDQPSCRIFRLEGGTYKEKPQIANVTAGDLSPDGRIFAVAWPGATIQLLDAATLAPLPETPEMKTTFIPPEATAESRIFSLVFNANGSELAATGMREPARIWKLRDGSFKLFRAKSIQDQVVRIAFGRGHATERDVAAGMNSRVRILDINDVSQIRAEPVCLPDATVFPMFSSDGKKLLTLSGPFWMGMDTLRIWDLSLPPAGDVSQMHLTGEDPPPWLPDLADAVAGLRTPAAIDEEDPRPPILSDVRKKYAETSTPDEYKPIWNRFFGSGQ
jgi:WD40 repeat protein